MAEKEKLRKMGLDIIGNISWGTHLCVFYQSKEDLIDILVPYFKAGLENNEFCMWVCWDPLRAKEARTALSKKLRNLDDYILKGQIEIMDYSKRDTAQGDSGFANMKQFWVEKEKQAFEGGFEGLRLCGNSYWLEKKEWNNFKKYEEEVDNIIRNHKMIALCLYSLDKCDASEIIDVVNNHKSAIIKREGKWEIIESTERKKTEEKIKSFSRFPEENINPVYRTSKDGVLLYANPASRKLILEDQTKIGEKIPEKWIKMIKNVYDSGKRQQIEIEFSGRIFLFDLFPIIKAGYVNSYATDITERKKAEETLKVSEEKFRCFFENEPEYCYMISADGAILDINSSALTALGYKKEEIVGKPLLTTIYAPSSFEKAKKLFTKWKKAGSLRNEELNIITKAGEQKIVLLSADAVKGSDGKTVYSISVQRDITERKKAELELQEQKLVLEQKNLALMEMIEHIERAKNKTKDDIVINVNEFLLPILKKLKLKGAPAKYINLIQRHLEELTSSFGRKITEKSIKLTSREIEICNMVKGGLTSKEIAELLNISQQTVDKHRKNIRHKLNLSKKGVNLSSFLHKL